MNMTEVREERKILLFDGVCNLCSALVTFTIRHGRNTDLMFASLQSRAASNLLKEMNLPKGLTKSVVYIVNDEYYSKSSGILHLLKDMGGLWKMFYAAIVIPEPIRDLAYDTIAGSRYRVFGKRQTCMVPTPELRERFLE